jgi:hypothetical protein
MRGDALRYSTLPFLDRERESRRIEEALLKKKNLLISGPAGIGKTALLQHVIGRVPAALANKCLYLETFKDLRDLLRKLIRAVYQARSPQLRRELHSLGVSRANLDAWLKSLSTSRLKGTLYRAAEGGDYRVVLDHVPPLTHANAKVVKELFWMRETPVYLLMRDDSEDRIAQLTRFFYWGEEERLTLGPLPPQSARRLMENCIRTFGLAGFDLEQLREEVLAFSKCVPGAIVKMCALAADPRYQYGERIKTKLVHIDYLMSRRHLKPSEHR